MTLKDPREIAQEIVRSEPLSDYDRDKLIPKIVKAIEADRAQFQDAVKASRQTAEVISAKLDKSVLLLKRTIDYIPKHIDTHYEIQEFLKKVGGA